MASIAIVTDDPYLSRMLTLLLAEEGHTVNGDAPVLLITDCAELPPRLAALPTLHIGEGAFARPFSHTHLKAAVNALLSEEHQPLLTPTEQRLFDALRAAAPNPVSREALSDAAFGEMDGGRLNLYIHYLRKKLEADGRKRIFSAHGKGYYYDA